MPLQVEIVPSTDAVHMFGSQETSSGYSLSGQVILSMIPGRSAFGSYTAPQPGLLTSLVVTFEGKTEAFEAGQGYVGRRLCQRSETLVVPTKPVAIPSTPNHKVAVIFDIVIPGWIPSTMLSKHATTSSTSYSLHATAIYSSDESWLGQRSKTVMAPEVPIQVKRNRTSSPPKPCSFAVKPGSESTSPETKPEVHVKATIPSYVRCTDDAFSLQLDVSCAHPGVKVHRFATRVVQSSKYSTSPDPGFTSIFPLPAAQPPSVPLFSPHPLEDLQSVAIRFPSNAVRIDKDDLMPGGTTLYNMREGSLGYPLEKEPSTVSVALQLEPTKAKPGYLSPFLQISHKLFVDFDISYNDKREKIGFELPLHVVDLSSSDNLNQGLPAYIQLFHSNGEARYEPGLPAYSKDCLQGEISDKTGIHPVELQRRHRSRLSQETAAH